MTFLKFLSLVLCIGLTGWSWQSLFFSRQRKIDNGQSIQTLLKEHIITFFTGFGVCSILCFLIAIAGWFEIKIILSLFIIPLFFAFLRIILQKHEKILINTGRYLLSCLVFALSCFGLTQVVKPFEAVIYGDDASIYIGAAYQLSRTGSLSYEDRLVVEMTPEERNRIFNNRFPVDTTGDKIRFPGGVRLINSSKGKVVFSFYHLFPVWLALGIEMLGDNFLSVMSLFVALQFIALLLVAYELGGLLLGISVSVVYFVFYPQLYFSLAPTSELLAQALFLSGLWVVVSGIRSQSALSAPQQNLVGVLWGSLFLCRLETLYMLCLALVLLFTTLPVLANNWHKWRILITHLVFFFFLAIYYQIIRGEYLYVLTSSLFLGNRAIVLVGIELLNSVIDFAQNHPFLNAGAFLIFVATTILGLWKWILIERPNPRYFIKASVGILLVGLLIVPMVTHFASWARFTKHVRWISIYFAPQILIALSVGVFFYLYRMILEKPRTILLMLFVMFLIPTVSYLIHPVIIIEQPWAIRKFVPQVFPLFFLISFTGFYYFLKRVFVNSRFFPNAVFSVMILFLVPAFFVKSRYLIDDALFANVSVQLNKLASRLPPNAVTVIPESWGAMHLQMALQYRSLQDTILLPVESNRDNPLSRNVISYLSRQVEQRPVMVLLKSSEDPPRLLRKSFRLNSVSRDNFSFRIVPRTYKIEFPNHSETVSFDYTLFSIMKRKDEFSEKLFIAYDDSEVTFLNFHNKENGFRWTKDRSAIKDFIYHTNEKPTTITIHAVPGYSYYGSDDQSIQILVNDKIPAFLVNRTDGDFIFELEASPPAEIKSVTIFSKTFVPVEKRINLDNRPLGICFNKLSFQTKS